MNSYVIIDIIVALVVILSALFAYSRGFVREILSITGWVFSFFVAFLYAPIALPLVNAIPYLGGFFENNCEIAVLAAFILIFALTLFICSIITPLLSNLVRSSELSGFDSAVGFLFGALRGAILAIIFFIVYERFLGNSDFIEFEESRAVEIYGQIRGSMSESLPAEVPEWALSNYENLIGQCVTGGGDDSVAPSQDAVPTEESTDEASTSEENQDEGEDQGAQ